jgi:hypothetical protein
MFNVAVWGNLKNRLNKFIDIGIAFEGLALLLSDSERQAETAKARDAGNARAGADGALQ